MKKRKEVEYEHIRVKDLHGVPMYMERAKHMMPRVKRNNWRWK